MMAVMMTQASKGCRWTCFSKLPWVRLGLIFMRLAKSRPSLLLKAFSKKNTSLFGLLHLLVLCVALFSAGQGVAKPFVIGKVSDNPKKHYGYLKPMADYLANQLAEFGYSDGKVLLATNTQQLKQYMSAGQIDMVTETLFTAVELQDEVNAEPIVLKWKKGTPTYASIIFVRKDSEITSVEDLRGKIIAFEDRGSTSAFYIPIAELITAELELENIPSARAQRSTAKVSYVFTGEEINTSVLVHKKIVHAGAYSDENWKKEDHLPQALRGDTKKQLCP